MMTRLPDADFDRLVREARDRHNLSDIVGRHTDLKTRGARELVGLCCFHSERTPSLEVNNAKGTYYCHGCGAGGDAISFLVKQEGMTFFDAVKWLHGDTLPIVGEEERARRKAEDQRLTAERVALARSIWEAAGPVPGTPGEVYLRARGISTAAPLTIRFGMVPRWRDPDTGEVGRTHPALVGALQNVNDDIVGVQCVFLQDGGQRKYDRLRPDGSKAKAKLSFGVIVGSALRLGPKSEHVVLCEGPEDGLSLLSQAPDANVWVSCGTAMMSRVEPPWWVRAVTLAGDNGDAGRVAVEEAEAAFLKRGLAVSRIFPDPRFKDWNDELRGVVA